MVLTHTALLGSKAYLRQLLAAVEKVNASLAKVEDAYRKNTKVVEKKFKKRG